ncbi:F-box/kelch-repeat protein [Striga hermonthica]|uniref:F-box/kelch-repeat protein n=1 Tax=Striga hermonthica TaxID=68872 RepID=A0A9N7NP21_STRHE|nr:F-box/kelch-repeat protein [Striga hermonthica]
MGAVSKRWRSFIQSKEFTTVRKLAGMLEEWLYILTLDAEGKESHWEVQDCLGNKHRRLPAMPGPIKVGFSVVALNGKLLVIAGYFVVEGTGSVSADVYQYDPCLNRWSKLASMNVARYDFACAEVDGRVYAVGGCGAEGKSLSCAEVYDPDANAWAPIEGLPKPRWGCFVCGFKGRVYVMGGRLSFTIGNSRSVEVYNPGKGAWVQMKKGASWSQLMQWLGTGCASWSGRTSDVSRYLHQQIISWKLVPVPLTGSSSIDFRFGILDGKLMLFSITLAVNKSGTPPPSNNHHSQPPSSSFFNRCPYRSQPPPFVSRSFDHHQAGRRPSAIIIPRSRPSTTIIVTSCCRHQRCATIAGENLSGETSSATQQRRRAAPPFPTSNRDREALQQAATITIARPSTHS